MLLVKFKDTYYLYTKIDNFPHYLNVNRFFLSAGSLPELYYIKPGIAYRNKFRLSKYIQK